MVVGLFAGVAVVQYRAYRLSGVLVVPLVAVYSLYNFATLPLFLLAFLTAYLALYAVKRWTLLYGRSLLLVGIAVGAAVPLGAAVIVERELGVPVFTAVEFVGTILPGIAAYNYHQLKARRQLQDAAVSLATLAALIGLGAALVRPVAASQFAEVAPPVLLGPDADVAVLLGATVSAGGYESPVATEIALTVVAVGLVLAETLRDRWGLRADGIISIPLLVVFTLADSNALVLYLLLLGVSYLLIVTMMDATLLYGRVVLSFALVTCLLLVAPLVQVVPLESGLVAFFTAVFAGIGTYNFQRVQPSERFTSVLVTGGLFAFLLGVPLAVSSETAAVTLPFPPWYLVMAGLLVGVSLRELYRLERGRPSLPEDRGRLGRVLRTAGRLVRRGVSHRRRLSDVDRRIVVSGTRGKSGTVRRLHDVFHERGHDTMAKITGNRPISLRNGEAAPVQRGSKVTLYENEREIREHKPEDVLVVENQGITGYTTYVVNRFFVKPHVVVLTNVRRDHLDTLGDDRASIARSFARSVPPGVHVVSGEQDPEIQRYLDEQLGARGVSVTHVDVPERHADVPGAEVIHALDEVLRLAGEEPLSRERREAFLDDFRVEWTVLPNGRVFDAAEVNDVESTEAVRRALQDDEEEEVVLPFLYLRGDRRSRTASFLDYLGDLHDRGVIERAHVAGSGTGVFAARADFPVVQHDEDRESAGEVLDEMLTEGPPVLVVGNTVATFMRDLEAAIEERAAAVPDEAAETPPDALAADRPRASSVEEVSREHHDHPGVSGAAAGEPSRESYLERPDQPPATDGVEAPGESAAAAGGRLDTPDRNAGPDGEPEPDREPEVGPGDFGEAPASEPEASPADPHEGPLPNRLTFVGGTDEAPADYRFEVSGFAVERSDDREGPPLSGERIQGTLAGEQATYRFRGDLTDIAVSGPAAVRLNGESLPAEEFPDPPADRP